MTTSLRIQDLHTHYGPSHVLQGVELDVDISRLMVTFGRNGMGKTTFVHSLVGMKRATSGSVTFDGEELIGLPSYRIARKGIALVPQGRRVFGPLSVEENLAIGAGRSREGQWTIERIYDLMPRLSERRNQRSSNLSGGEQQMLAIGRALLTNPRLLILDEPSEGLAPIIVEQVSEVLTDLKSQGVGVLLVEQNLGMGIDLADDVCIMVKGRIAWRGTVEEFRGRRDLAHSMLGVA